MTDSPPTHRPLNLSTFFSSLNFPLKVEKNNNKCGSSGMKAVLFLQKLMRNRNICINNPMTSSSLGSV